MNPCEDSAKAFFDRLIELESPEKRVRLLDAECGPDLDLRTEVEGLLLAYDQAGSFLERPALGDVPTQVFAGTNTDPNAEDCKTFLEKPEIPLDLLAPSEKEGSQRRLGQYEILESVGRGGMGIVLKGHDTKLNRIVAVKILAPELASNATARTRFSKEAQAAAAVSHDHVVTIHAVEECSHQGGKNLRYLVMEYVDGLSLQEKIDRDGPLELKEILRIAHQIAAGLSAAHLQGLIHQGGSSCARKVGHGIWRSRGGGPTTATPVWVRTTKSSACTISTAFSQLHSQIQNRAGLENRRVRR